MKDDGSGSMTMMMVMMTMTITKMLVMITITKMMIHAALNSNACHFSKWPTDLTNHILNNAKACSTFHHSFCHEIISSLDYVQKLTEYPEFMF